MWFLGQCHLVPRGSPVTHEPITEWQQLNLSMSIPSEGKFKKDTFNLSATFTFDPERPELIICSHCCQQQNDISWTSLCQVSLVTKEQCCLTLRDLGLDEQKLISHRLVLDASLLDISSKSINTRNLISSNFNWHF